MSETTRRSLLERLVGKPLPWLAWVWVALAAVWIVLAVVDPSGFHRSMAIVWSILAAVQIGSISYARRQELQRAQNDDRESATR
ncbi:hypothetical protein EDF24_3575 [Curtobacterium sp. PhB130]|uniref:hypothetical protein n=1 Tax=Curtobacterium sp. PhB130 TaxID=2485178 RepID=UPI000F4BCCE4|nr:hypothetical protein [Curtobacterium sp. PhB130]ROS71930.1 hypothetical protein EDF24_3575 [Curtobacterium sp. PhB130]